MKDLILDGTGGAPILRVNSSENDISQQRIEADAGG